MDYQDCMLDLETLDSGPNSTIVAIGAVAFDLNGNDTPESLKGAPERSFYTTVDTWEQGLHGRTMGNDTIMWWLQQNEAARLAIAKPMLKLEPALKLLKVFSEELGCRNLWGYGATFDNVIIAEAFKAYKVKSPFPYRNQFCMRTIVNLANIDRPSREGFTEHHALADAQYQVILLQKAYRALTRGTA
jgi:hypothetical protein